LAAASLDAVARIAHPTAEPLLSAQLMSKDAVMKGIAIEGLARLGERAKWASIQGATTKDRAETVLLALNFAAVRLADSPIDPIVDSLARPKLHDQAFGYLVELADGGAARLGRRLQDPQPRVRAELVDALGLSYEPALAPLLSPMASDPDVDVARAVDRALARVRPGR
jgi:hypothetical protein